MSATGHSKGVETEGMLSRPDGHRLAWRKVTGREGPAVVWLNGFRSDMQGAKATAVADWAKREDRTLVRFDYFGHGASTGDFSEGTISRWLQDTLVVIDWLTQGEVVLAGSSMGGWIACLAALARPDRLRALVLTAPAADFTDKLMEPQFNEAAREALRREGVHMETSPHDPDCYPITRALLQDGRRWSVLPGPIAIRAPVRIIQGGADVEVPWAHAMKLYQAIQSPDAIFTLIRDGDHRLSRPQDISRLIAAVAEVAG